MSLGRRLFSKINPQEQYWVPELWDQVTEESASSSEIYSLESQSQKVYETSKEEITVLVLLPNLISISHL